MSVMRRILAPSFPRAVVRLARERWGLSVRVHDRLAIIDAVYGLGWRVGTNIFRPRWRDDSSRDRTRVWYPTAREHEHDAQALATFLEGVYEGWIEAAACEMHDAIAKYLEEAA